MTFWRKYRLWIAIFGSLILVSLALVFALRKTVTLSVNGESRTLTTYAFNVGSLLHQLAVPLSPSDRLSPSADSWLKNNTTISLIRAIPVQISTSDSITTIISPERVPSRLLEQVGVQVKPCDLLLSNGRHVAFDQAFPLNTRSISLQLVREVNFTLTENGQTNSLTSTAPTLGAALWAAGYTLYASDQLTPAASTPLTEGLAAVLNHARPLTIHTQSGDVTLRTAASTVGAALQAAHLSLQGLDYSLPAADKPLPANGEVRLVRVTEQVVIEETKLPFETQFQPDSELEVDNQAVLQAGEDGIQAQRVRIRYEDGLEASRKVDSEWTARQPRARIIGYGTALVMHTTTVDGVTIQYWRSLTVWVTSYHPSETGSNRTATGALVEKGVVGVNPYYIPYHTKLYIPGYGNGEALDTGNITARWIDLAYPDDEYIPWHQYVTIYFLWPPPDKIVWIIP